MFASFDSPAGVAHPTTMKSRIALTRCLLLLLPQTALGHIEITSHATRYPSSALKNEPCGSSADSGPGSTIHTLERGQTLKIVWDEFIDHPGHYRISFDASGNDAFVEPNSASDFYVDPTVLLDDIADLDGVRTYEQSVTLPDVACERCTLQLLQVMTDKPPFGDGNDIYHQCIDLRLTEPGAAGSGGSTSSGGATGIGGLVGAEAGADGAGDRGEATGCAFRGPAPRDAGLWLSLPVLAGFVARRRHASRNTAT